MSFKLHLVIVSFIIFAVYLAWQLTSLIPAAAPEPVAKTATHVIAITHASWGLNCSSVAINGDMSHDAFAKHDSKNNKLHEDNVLEAVSLSCNGKTDCDVLVDEKNLGEDPSPDCNNKMLSIEYRCFSYDRPWIEKSSTEVSLHCDNNTK